MGLRIQTRDSRCESARKSQGERFDRQTGVETSGGSVARSIYDVHAVQLPENELISTQRSSDNAWNHVYYILTLSSMLARTGNISQKGRSER